MNLSLLCNKIIKYSFYILFFVVPIIFWGNTSELFELNKMFFTYGITLIIFAAWFIKIIIEKKIQIKRTPLDIFLILFLFSQFISTFISLDSHVSFWGYYSRFNGGLLSTMCYVFLYFALLNHFSKNDVITLIKIMLITGFIVAAWGIPSHFGYDPTCFVFRRELNVACWTDAFKPTIRIFSTLGQPAWMAAYLATLIPLSMSMFFASVLVINSKKEKNHISSSKYQVFKSNYLLSAYYFLLTTLLYLALLYTNTRAGFIGFWVANIIFWLLIFIRKYFSLKRFVSLFFILNSLFLILNFLNGTPIEQINKFTLSYIFTSRSIDNAELSTTQQIQSKEVNITNSADIRKIVWRGAIDAWKAYPIFGSGVETFAFAYYKYRPIEHNLTSEWDYLYNKAHNEYLNYLTTTGILGLGSYLIFIGVFIFQVIKFQKHKWTKSQKSDNAIAQNNDIKEKHPTINYEIVNTQLLSLGLFAGWISILITNFFGFSVVIMNLFLFIIPAFVFILADSDNNFIVLPRLSETENQTHISVSRYLVIISILITSFYVLLVLFRFWHADTSYSLGLNLSRNNYPQEAYASLNEAVSIRPNEPVFKDELSITTLQLSLILFQQNEATLGAQLAKQAVDLNNEVLKSHPNYLPFWKTRVRMFYALSELDPTYTNIALEAAEKSASLAPTDAKIWYNLGVLYGQVGYERKGEEILLKTIEMKNDYQDAYLALGLLYHQMATNEKGEITDKNFQTKAEGIINNLLKKYPDNQQAKKTITDWKTKEAN